MDSCLYGPLVDFCELGAWWETASPPNIITQEYNLSTEFNNRHYADLFSGICQMNLHYIWIPFPRFVLWSFLIHLFVFNCSIFQTHLTHIIKHTMVMKGKYINCLEGSCPIWWQYPIYTDSLTKTTMNLSQYSHIPGECVSKILLKYKPRALWYKYSVM